MHPSLADNEEDLRIKGKEEEEKSNSSSF